MDFVLGAGDLELDYYGFIVSSLNRPLLFVFGNHNLSRLPVYKKRLQSSFELTPGESYLQPSFGSTYIGSKVKTLSEVIVAGLGGSKKYNDGLNQFTELGMFIKILKVLPKLFWNRIVHHRYLDILLTHAPPFGIGDHPDPCHRGFKVFRWFLRTFRPLYMIHGHIHLFDLNAQRESVYFDTRIVNAYDHCIIEIEENDIRSKRPSHAGEKRL